MIEPLTPHMLDDTMVASIGFFDGVHAAHQALIKRTITQAESLGKVPVAITFDVHPKSVIFDLSFKYITPLEKKIALLKAYGIERVFVLTFDKAMSKLSAEAFMKEYLNGVHMLVCGFDFRFGHGGLGTPDTLKSHGTFHVDVMEEMRFSSQKIGSTLIRELIQSGNMDEVRHQLGRYFSITGEVIHGEKKGRLIGYPTANIELIDVITPKRGVYATMTQVGKTLHPSMTSVGYNPTLNASHPLSVESYLFDFDETIYGEVITTYFIQWLRGEQKFEAVADLIAQIDEDAKESKAILDPIKNALPSPLFVL